MPTPIEIQVMEILSSIEIEHSAAQLIEKMGADAISLTCEVASGAVPGLRNKVRTNAVALLGFMNNQQAKESVQLLVNDPKSDVAIRAMRATARMKLSSAVGDIAVNLHRRDLSPLLAAEAVKALLAIDTPAARQEIDSYRRAHSEALPHRNAPVVVKILTGSQ